MGAPQVPKGSDPVKVSTHNIPYGPEPPPNKPPPVDGPINNPGKPQKCGSSGFTLYDQGNIKHLVDLHDKLWESGTTNVAGCRVPLESNWNFDFLRSIAVSQFDMKTVDYLQFGAPANIDHEAHARPPLPLLSYIYRTIWYSSVPLQGVRCLILIFFTPNNLNKISVNNFFSFFWGVTVVGHRQYICSLLLQASFPHLTHLFSFPFLALLSPP